jgi:4a-hydroxytetrahydrobiopterin dehydratase
MIDLKKKSALPIAKRSLSATELVASLAKLDGWHLSGDGSEIAIGKIFRFSSYYETIAFVNAVAFIAHAANHHPTLLVDHDHCEVRWRTHKVAGISACDLDCAARTDALLTASAA